MCTVPEQNTLCSVINWRTCIYRMHFAYTYSTAACSHLRLKKQFDRRFSSRDMHERVYRWRHGWVFTIVRPTWCNYWVKIRVCIETTLDSPTQTTFERCWCDWRAYHLAKGGGHLSWINGRRATDYIVEHPSNRQIWLEQQHPISHHSASKISSSATRGSNDIPQHR